MLVRFAIVQSVDVAAGGRVVRYAASSVFRGIVLKTSEMAHSIAGWQGRA